MKHLKTTTKNIMIVGWNEWCSLPKLKIPLIKAKVDTGAKTSALHAFNIKSYTRHGASYVKFDIHPLQHDETISVQCHAEIIDQRYVTSSNGHKEHRYVIQTSLRLGNEMWTIDITLSNRDPLKYRMLLGREALRKKVIIDPNRTTLLGNKSPKSFYTF